MGLYLETLLTVGGSIVLRSRFGVIRTFPPTYLCQRNHWYYISISRTLYNWQSENFINIKKQKPVSVFYTC